MGGHPRQPRHEDVDNPQPDGVDLGPYRQANLPGNPEDIQGRAYHYVRAYALRTTCDLQGNHTLPHNHNNNLQTSTSSVQGAPKGRVQGAPKGRVQVPWLLKKKSHHNIKKLHSKDVHKM